MRAHTLKWAVFGVLAITAAMGTLGALQRASADDGSVKDKPLEWSIPRYGFSWTKPDDPLWVWIPEDKWTVVFGSKPDNIVAVLAKFGVPGGEYGKDAFKILIFIQRYGTEGGGKLKIGDKDFDPLNIKGMSDAIWDQAKENYKDIKTPKPPAQIARYKFDNKIIGWSFTGVDKKNGQTGFHEGMMFKGNSKYVFQINCECPSQDERVVRQELDRVLNAIKVEKPK